MVAMVAVGAMAVPAVPVGTVAAVMAAAAMVVPVAWPAVPAVPAAAMVAATVAVGAMAEATPTRTPPVMAAANSAASLHRGADIALMEDLRAFLEVQGCFAVGHSGRTLGTHLMNTCELVISLGGGASAALAGGLHSIYGTNAFDKTTLPYAARAEIAARFGARAEYLAYLFSRINRPRDIETGLTADRKTRARIEISADDLHDLRLIEAANLLEQGYDLTRFPTIEALTRR
jgi:hypothetical protein